jgi:hypothetical protein
MIPEAWPWMLAIAVTAIGCFIWGLLHGRQDGYALGHVKGWEAGHGRGEAMMRTDAVRQGLGWWEVEVGGQTHFHWMKVQEDGKLAKATPQKYGGDFPC